MNPFIYQKPVPDHLIDRENELESLARAVRDGVNIRLSAPRRYGKTSLLQRLVNDVRNDDSPAVYVNLYGVLSLDEIVERIERAYSEQLRGGLQTWFRSTIRMLQPVFSPPGTGVSVRPKEADANRKLHSLLDLPVRIYKKTSKRTVIVFDEFQDLLASSPSPDGLIRSKIEFHNNEAVYIFAGSHVGLMRELFDNRERPFYAQARPLDLKPLPDDALGTFVAEQFALTSRDVGEVIEPFLQLVDGHPQRAMLVAHHIWNETPAGGSADGLTWENALNCVYLELKETLNTIWSGLSENERIVVTVIAQSEDGSLDSKLLQKYHLPRTTAMSIRDRLIEAGELIAELDRPKIVDPLFAVWVRNGRQSFVCGEDT